MSTPLPFRNQLVFLCLAAGLSGLPAFADSVGWLEGAPMGDPRQEVAVVELDGKVYVFGGFRPDASVADTAEVYDPVTDSWDFIAPMPAALHHPGAGVVDGKIYVVGGFVAPFVAQSSVFEYDPVGNSWSQKASMPTARGSFPAQVIDGLIYAAGGSPPERETDFAAYDPPQDLWTVLPNMPTGRNHHAVGTGNGKFYAIGGRSGGIGGLLDVVEEYDPVAQTWVTRTPMPTARGGVGGATFGPYIIVFGGEGNDMDPDGVFDDTEAYDTLTDQWIVLPPMPTGRHGIDGAVVGNRVYVPGGGDQQALGTSGSNEIFLAGGIAGYAGVFCDVALDKQVYTDGDTVLATKLQITNAGGAALPVELKAWVQPPASAPSRVLNFGAGGTFSPQPGFDFDLAPRPLLTVTGSTAPGAYQFGCRVLDPITGAELTLDVDNFQVQ